MIRRLARTFVAASCRATTALKLAERRARDRLTILCYHRVLPADQKNAYFLPDLVVTPESFRRQCEILIQHYDVLPLHEAVEGFGNRSDRLRPVAAITFDDGYRDNFRFAAPILGEMNLRATFFVIAGLVGTEKAPWYDRLGYALTHMLQNQPTRYRECASTVRSDFRQPVEMAATAASPRQVVSWVKELAPGRRAELVERICAEVDIDQLVSADDRIMDWVQLKQLTDSGHEIGSHTQTHELLPQLDDHDLESEVAESRRAIEQGVGQPVRSFCYPNGDVDDRVARAVESAGYRCAVTATCGSNNSGVDLFRLRRTFIHEGRLAGLGQRTSSSLLRMELCNLADSVFLRRRNRRPLP